MRILRRCQRGEKQAGTGSNSREDLAAIRFAGAQWFCQRRTRFVSLATEFDLADEHIARLGRFDECRISVRIGYDIHRAPAWVLGVSRELDKKGGVQYLPTTVLVDTNGAIFKELGYLVGWNLV